jgi:transposase
MLVSYTNLSGEHCLCKTGCFTKDLKDLVSELTKEGVTDAAPEATGVYWASPYELSEESGIHVTLINPSRYKNSTRIKTDANDSIRIHRYHSCGILRHSHIANDLYRELRGYVHERNILQKQKSETLTRIRRLLTLMNIKLQHHVSDIEGVGSMKVLRAIASGTKDPEVLIDMMNVARFKTDRSELVSSPEGNYRPHFVTMLRMKSEEYDFFVGQMKKYETHMEALLKKIEESVIILKGTKNEADTDTDTDAEADADAEADTSTETSQKKKRKYTRKNQYGIDIKGYSERILGIDLTQVEGSDEKVLPDILSITGDNMNNRPTAEHFVGWLNLSPRRKQTGGKYIGNQTRHTSNPATQAFRISAQSGGAKSKGPLGALYRRLSATKGSRTAVKAVARKLGVLFYTLVKNKIAYDPLIAAERIKKQNEMETRRLHKIARKLGYEVKKIA